jgi:hypothetical protein
MPAGAAAGCWLLPGAAACGSSSAIMNATLLAATSGATATVATWNTADAGRHQLSGTCLCVAYASQWDTNKSTCMQQAPGLLPTTSMYAHTESQLSPAAAVSPNTCSASTPARPLLLQEHMHTGTWAANLHTNVCTCQCAALTCCCSVPKHMLRQHSCQTKRSEPIASCHIRRQRSSPQHQQMPQRSPFSN